MDGKKDNRNDSVTISAAALLALYDRARQGDQFLRMACLFIILIYLISSNKTTTHFFFNSLTAFKGWQCQ